MQPHGFLEVYSSQEAPTLFLVDRMTHLEESVSLLLHRLARCRCPFIAYEVSVSDSLIAIERVGLEVACCYPL